MPPWWSPRWPWSRVTASAGAETATRSSPTWPRAGCPPQARKGVAALLHGATLASISTYADNYRNNHPETARWHYVNIPVTADHYDSVRDCAPSPEGDCIIAAIDRFSAVLADASHPEDERAEALKFLVHFVADLHQPLHATTNNDRGGNDTRVTWTPSPCGCPQ